MLVVGSLAVVLACFGDLGFLGCLLTCPLGLTKLVPCDEFLWCFKSFKAERYGNYE